MAGEIARALRRSQPDVERVAAFVQKRRAEREAEERRGRLRNLLTEEVTQLTPQAEAAANAPNTFTGAPEIPIDENERKARIAGAMSGQQSSTRPYALEGPQTERVKRLKPITSEMYPDIADILKMTPEATVEGIARAQDSERRQASASIKSLSAGGELVDTRNGRVIRRNERTFAPPRERNVWFIRNGRKMWGVPGEGDKPLSDSQKKQWLVRGGKPVYDVYREGDQKYEKPSTAEGSAEKLKKRALDRIAKLTERNQNLGQKVRELKSGLFKDASGEVVTAGTPPADSLAAGYDAQIKTNEAILKRLNRQIGGEYGAGEQQQTPDADLDAADLRNRVREILEENGYDSEEGDIDRFLENNPEFDGEEE